jgi:hypothetical protein
MPILSINPTRLSKPYILLFLGSMAVLISMLITSSGALDYLKTTKKGDPPPLTIEIKNLDDAITDLRSIGCNIVESVVTKATSDTPPLPLSSYEEFRSYAYKKGTVFKVTTFGETTLYTSDDKQYYSWTPLGQTILLQSDYERLNVVNMTCTKVQAGWQITLTFNRTGELGDCLNRITVDGLEIFYPNYASNGVINNAVSTDLAYQGTYIDGTNISHANIWLSSRLDYKTGQSVFIRIKSIGGYVYSETVLLT